MRARGSLGFEHGLYRFASAPTVDVLGHERLRALPRRRCCASRPTGARRACCCWWWRCSLWVRGTDARGAQRAGASRARAGRGPLAAIAWPRGVGVRRARRLHLLQHQRAQPLPRRRPSARQLRGRATRSATSALAARAAAEGRRRRRLRRRPLPARAARCASRGTLHAGEQDRRRRDRRRSTSACPRTRRSTARARASPLRAGAVRSTPLGWLPLHARARRSRPARR